MIAERREREREIEGGGADSAPGYYGASKVPIIQQQGEQGEERRGREEASSINYHRVRKTRGKPSSSPSILSLSVGKS